MTNNKTIQAVPTNIVTGFLGAGKTSTILHFLAAKPTNERWAVLVNEFGEIGVDGSLFEGQHKEASGVYISEVPGGCMCCAAGVPMQIALNDLLRRARPDRLLIEPTGLGHPKEVLQVLSQEHYRDVLDIQKTLTLVDARKLADSRYTTHETFNQQIAIADIILGNKADLYEAGDRQKLIDYVAANTYANTQVHFGEFGNISPELLTGATLSPIVSTHHSHRHAEQALASELPIPECGFIKAENAGERYISTGWRFAPQKIFDLEKVRQFVLSTESERLKAVFFTEQGVFSFNKTEDGVQENVLDDFKESRIEIIAETEQPEWEQNLLNCLY